MIAAHTELALFDLDGTLLDGDSELAWAAFLADNGLIDRDTQRREQTAFEEAYTAGHMGVDAFLRYHLAPVRALQTKPRPWLDALNARFQNEVIAPMIRPAARSLVAEHLERGSLVALVTATNSFLAAPIARTLGVHHLVATVLDQDDRGNFTGHCKGVPAFRDGKIARVHDWLASMGAHLAGFERTWFYSDSCNDLPLLAHVSHPVAVTPDDVLRREAETMNWQIIERSALG